MPPSDGDHTSDSDFDIVSHSPSVPPAASSSVAPPPSRRSSRVKRLAADAPSLGRAAAARAESLAARRAANARRDAEFEQVVPATPGVAGVPPASYSVVLNPCAAAVVFLHAHLAKTEIIGFLGGVVSGDGDERKVYALEAFPVRNLSARDLKAEGRSAANEVEMEPESMLEVSMQIASKGMSIVGWYHSHPYFSAAPSEIDVENQFTQQTQMFNVQPHVAAICSPFWDDLPDARPKLDMFEVEVVGGRPVDVGYDVAFHMPAEASEAGRALVEATGGGGSTAGRGGLHEVQYRLSESVRATGNVLVEEYASFPRRVDLHSEWRGGVSILHKILQGFEMSLGNGRGLPKQPVIASSDDSKAGDENAKVEEGTGAAGSGNGNAEVPPDEAIGGDGEKCDGVESVSAPSALEEKVTLDAGAVVAVASSEREAVPALGERATALVGLLRSILADAGKVWSDLEAARKEKAAEAAKKRGKKRRKKC